MSDFYYLFHNIKLRKPSFTFPNTPHYQLKVGKRKIKNNKDGAKRLEKIIQNWNYYALTQNEFFKLTGYKYLNLWSPKLKDVKYNNFPPYILDYDYELRKIVSKIKEFFNRHKGYKNYLTLFNGGSPFLIYMSRRDVYIYKNDKNRQYQYVPQSLLNKKLSDMAKFKLIYNFNELVQYFKYNKEFIGKCPYEGKKFDGNSFLFNIQKDKYIFVGKNIFQFKSITNIIKFISPIGNSGVSYPYAIDINKNYYLFLENIILQNVPEKYINDPYIYYYENKKISAKKITTKKLFNKYNILYLSQQ